MSMLLILFQLLIGSLVRNLQQEQVSPAGVIMPPESPQNAAPAHAWGKGVGEQACGHTPITLPLPRMKPLFFMPLLFQRNAACIAPVNWKQEWHRPGRLCAMLLVSQRQVPDPLSMPTWCCLSSGLVGESYLEPWQVLFSLPAPATLDGGSFHYHNPFLTC